MQVFRRFRFLGCIVLLAVVAAAWELTNSESEQSPTNQQLPYVMRELYPESSRIRYVEAMGFVMEGNLPAARQKFEQALASGEKTNEDLLYYYAVTLVKMDADPQEIDEAIAAWRFNSPFSSRTDPRALEEASPDPEIVHP